MPTTHGLNIQTMPTENVQRDFPFNLPFHCRRYTERGLTHMGLLGPVATGNSIIAVQQLIVTELKGKCKGLSLSVSAILVTNGVTVPAGQRLRLKPIPATTHSTNIDLHAIIIRFHIHHVGLHKGVLLLNFPSLYIQLIQLLVPLWKNANPNRSIKCKLFWNSTEYGEIDWSVCFFVFQWWDKKLEINCTERVNRHKPSLQYWNN